jgi:hypothetical protein
LAKLISQLTTCAVPTLSGETEQTSAYRLSAPDSGPSTPSNQAVDRPKSNVAFRKSRRLILTKPNFSNRPILAIAIFLKCSALSYFTEQLLRLPLMEAADLPVAFALTGSAVCDDKAYLLVMNAGDPAPKVPNGDKG